MTRRTVKVGDMSPGINNRLPPTQLNTLTPDRRRGTFLYGAENVDINQKGYLQRREGQTMILEGDAHSLWSDGKSIFSVIDGVLWELSSSGTALSPAAAPIHVGMSRTPVSYSRGADNDVYWTNGDYIRRVAAGLDRPISTPAPELIPTISLVSGALRPGQYLLAFTATGVDGESAATPTVAIDVPENGGIAISDTSVNVYMSGPNGDILTLQDGAAGSVLVHNETGRICRTLNLAQMPPGSIVRHYNGRMLVTAGNVLYFSEPYNYGLYNPSKGYVPFAHELTLLEPTTNGLWIGTTAQTFWIQDVLTDVLQQVLPYGATPNTSGRSPDGEQVFWNSPMGMVLAGKNMDVEALQAENIEFGSATGGATLYRKRNGATHLVASRADAGLPTAAASSYMEARIVQQGTNL